jgi:hypothetical protein
MVISYQNWVFSQMSASAFLVSEASMTTAPELQEALKQALPSLFVCRADFNFRRRRPSGRPVGRLLRKYEANCDAAFARLALLI